MKIRISTSPPMIGKRIKAKTYLGKTGADANMVTTAADGKANQAIIDIVGSANDQDNDRS